MALITSIQIVKKTSMSGSVDVNNYRHLIDIAQVTSLEPLIGSTLYRKIVADQDAGSLTGVYETIYNNYVIDFLCHTVYAMYLKDANVLAKNGGVFERTQDGFTNPDLSSLESLYKQAQSISDVYAQRLVNFLCSENVPEYDNQDNDYDVDPRNNDLIGGLYLGNNYGLQQYYDAFGNKIK